VRVLSDQQQRHQGTCTWLFESTSTTSDQSQYQKKWLVAVSDRIAFTSSVLDCPKGWKMLGWTEYLIDRIQALRVKELADYADYRKFATYRNVFAAVPETLAPPLTLMVRVTSMIFGTNE
jgi:hypothetical protein